MESLMVWAFAPCPNKAAATSPNTAARIGLSLPVVATAAGFADSLGPGADAEATK